MKRRNGLEVGGWECLTPHRPPLIGCFGRLPPFPRRPVPSDLIKEPQQTRFDLYSCRDLLSEIPSPDAEISTA
jgi:hypothetical protein